MKKLKLNIKGMHCASCSKLIENELVDHKGVSMVKINEETGKAVIVYNEEEINPNKIKDLVASAGDYEAEEYKEDISEYASATKTSDEGNSLKGVSTYFNVMITMIGIGLVVIIIMLINQNDNSSQTARNNGNNNGGAVADNRAPANNNEQPPQNNQPTASAEDIEITTADHIRGNIDAPITILEYSDFQCPFCARFHETMIQVMENYPEDVRWVYKHFPIDSIHPLARTAAEASECAADQDKFWEYSDELYANYQSMTQSTFTTIAENLNLNMNDFNSCLDSDKYAEKVNTQFQEASSIGVTGTPGNFINGEVLGGAVPYEQLVQMIEARLE